jgi:hypothetical protein
MAARNDRKFWIAQTQQDVARAFGVTPQTIRLWCRRGCPRRADNGYDVIAIARWHQLEFNKPEHSPVAPGDAVPDAWAERKLRTDALRGELKLDAEKGNTFTRAAVTKLAGDRAMAFRTGLLSMGAALAQELEGIPAAEIGMILERHTMALLASYVGEGDEWVKQLDHWAAMETAGTTVGKRGRGRPKKA